MRYPRGMSIEGGIKGDQKKLTCPKCGKVFTAWRPDTAPGAKVKCYFCKTEFEDEAAKRPVPPKPEPPPAAAPAPAAPTETPS
jgi:NAD-dependent SIR2 family protein deacetylase